MKTFQHLTCAALSIMFIWFVTLQFNDIDAWLWVLAYGLPATLSLLCLSGRVRPILHRVSLILCFAYTLWAILLYQETTGRWWDGEVEREVGGLVITALAMLILNIISRHASRFP